MNKIFLNILREVGIALGILVVLLAVTVIAFKDQLPFDDKVPSGEEYVKANLKTYSVSSTDRLAEVNKIKITHETNSGQIIDAENEVRILTGKYTPFGTIDSITDLPSERVGISMSPSLTEDSSSDEGNSNGSQDLNYPISEDEKNLITSGETKLSQEVAEQRMGNVE